MELSDSVIKSALISTGDPARLRRVFQKARNGQKVVLGVFGGSITQGSSASSEALRYANRVHDWLVRSFPLAAIELVNAGIGATGSPYGCLRVQRDLLIHQPDLVIIDFAVNDGGDQGTAEAYEGVVRQVLGQNNAPAVLLVFFMHKNGGNAQALQQRLGEHYQLPMISYRDALWPEILAGRLSWSDISAEEVHPNDRGHAFTASAIEHALGHVRDGAPWHDPGPNHADHSVPSDAGPISGTSALTPPLFNDTFARTSLIDRDALRPSATSGWAYDESGSYLASHTPGSSVHFEGSGTAIFVLYYRDRADLGRVRVQVDDAPPFVLDGWFPETWGGYIDTRVVRDLKPGIHDIRLELLSDKHELSGGHQFRIIGIGAAGPIAADRLASTSGRDASTTIDG